MEGEISPSSLLQRACSEGDNEALQELLNVHEFDRQTLSQALYLAVSRSHSTSDHFLCVETLLSHDANPSFRGPSGNTLLMHAAKMGHIELVELLLGVVGIEERDNEKRTALMYAVDSDFGDNADVVKLMVSRGAQLDAQDAMGNSALHRCAERGYANSIKALMQESAFANIQNVSKDTPLHLAVRNKREDSVRILLSFGANSAQKNIEGRTPYEEAEEEIRSLFSPEALNPPKQTLEEEESNTSFSSLPESHTFECELCKAIVLEGFCKPCIEGLCHREKLARDEISAVNSELSSEINNLKQKLEEANKTNCELQKQVKRIQQEKETLYRAYQEDFESSQKAILDLKTSMNFLEEKNSSLTQRVEELQKIKNQNGSKFGKNSSLLNIRNLQSISREKFLSSLQKDVEFFLYEVDSWQESTSPALNKMCTHIKKLVEDLFPEGSLCYYGSFSYNLNLPSSDIDMVLTNVEGNVRSVLSRLQESLCKRSFVKETNLIANAVVPVLKVKVEWDSVPVHLDFTVQDIKHSGLRCVDFVKRVLSFYKNIRPVVLLLKQLFYVCDFKEPYTGGLSSYSLFLMVTSYFQTCSIPHTKTQDSNYIGELFSGVLNYYANEFMYLSPIQAYDPTVRPPPFHFTPVNFT